MFCIVSIFEIESSFMGKGSILRLTSAKVKYSSAEAKYTFPGVFQRKYNYKVILTLDLLDVLIITPGCMISSLNKQKN